MFPKKEKAHLLYGFRHRLAFIRSGQKIHPTLTDNLKVLDWIPIRLGQKIHPWQSECIQVYRTFRFSRYGALEC